MDYLCADLQLLCSEFCAGLQFLNEGRLKCAPIVVNYLKCSCIYYIIIFIECGLPVQVNSQKFWFSVLTYRLSQYLRIYFKGGLPIIFEFVLCSVHGLYYLRIYRRLNYLCLFRGLFLPCLWLQFSMTVLQVVASKTSKIWKLKFYLRNIGWNSCYNKNNWTSHLRGITS